MAAGTNTGTPGSVANMGSGSTAVANAGSTAAWVSSTLQKAQASGIAITGRAGGGSMAPGETAWVGEKGPELYTAGASGGAVTPNGAVGGNVTHIYITQPLGTPAAIAAAVDAALIARQRQIGTRF